MIKRVTLKKQSYDYLLNAITEEKIKPSEIYSEQYFADILDVSRTPIREAVLQLSEEGFLQIHPNKGFSVKPISDKEIEDIFVLRSAIEGYCAVHAAENINTQNGRLLLNRLKEIGEMEKAALLMKASPEECMKNDTMFHNALIEFADNERFQIIITNLRAKIKLAVLKILFKEGRLEGTMKEHSEILKHIECGDKMSAYKAVQEHFAASIKAIIKER